MVPCKEVNAVYVSYQIE